MMQMQTQDEKKTVNPISNNSTIEYILTFSLSCIFRSELQKNYDNFLDWNIPKTQYQGTDLSNQPQVDPKIN